VCSHTHTHPGCSELDGCGESERLTSALNAVSPVLEHVTTTADVFLPGHTHTLMSALHTLTHQHYALWPQMQNYCSNYKENVQNHHDARVLL